MILITIHILTLSLIAYLWFSSLKDKSLSKHFFIGLILRVTGGIALGLVYKYHYQGGDTLSMFKDSVVLSKLAFNNTFTYFDFLSYNDHFNHRLIYLELDNHNPRVLLFVKLISLINIITSYNYWVTGFYFSFFSFWGSWKCITLFSQLLKGYKTPSLIAFVYFPSLIFWTGGVIKESIVFGCICIVIVSFLKYAHHEELKNDQKKKALSYLQKSSSLINIVITLISLYLLWKIKYYYFAVLLPILCTYLIVVLLKKKMLLSFQKQILIYFSILILFSFVATNIHPNLNISVIISAIVKNNHIMVSQTLKTENLIHFQNLTPSLTSILDNIPIALWEGFFRPYLWEYGSWVKRLAALENLILSGLIFFVVFQKIKYLFENKNKMILNKNHRILGLSLIIYILTTELIITLAAPNIGNLVRYKIGFMPFLLFWLLTQLNLPEPDKRANN